ncbi:ATP-binding protein [Streptomyces sp. CRN 30]|uniref:ATP-binding protein n=1 Tax=Streptomyces sp. CRN 30 TaxID=3075613 RepID=UPI0039C374BB
MAATAVAAVVVLVIRNRALEARRKQADAELTRRLAETDGHLRASQAQLQQFTAQQQESVREAEQAAEESTKAVLRGAARFLQSLTAEQTTLLDGIQQRYGGHAVLTDLLDVGHANQQMARKSQGIAVMCGAPLGRRNQPASVYDVVRSAQGQIRNHQRVEIMQQSGLALKASAVAPVALAVAELLDNAASFSQHDAPIEVTFQRVQSNLCIVIDDAGVGMNDEERQKATAMLSGEALPRLSQLGTQPKFGFPVIGLIAGKYGFKVDVTGVSRYGGVRAVVRLPEELWTMEETAPPAPEPPVRRIRRVDAPAPVGLPLPESAEATPAPAPAPAPARTMHGLPKRGQRQTPIASVTDTDTDATGSTPLQPRAPRRPRPSGGLGGLQRGTLSGRDLTTPAPEGEENA